jgi:hypothetical protein
VAKDNPDLDTIRKNLRVAYGWYDWFHLTENDDSEDKWIDEILS